MKDILVTYQGADGRLKIGFNKHPKKITGVEVLIQKVIRNLLNQINTNHFDPDLGSTLLTIAGRGYKSSEEEQVGSLMALMVSQIEDKLKEEQAASIRLLPEEQLEGLDLISISYDPSLGHWNLDIKIKTKANHSYLINI